MCLVNMLKAVNHKHSLPPQHETHWEGAEKGPDDGNSTDSRTHHKNVPPNWTGGRFAVVERLCIFRMNGELIQKWLMKRATSADMYPCCGLVSRIHAIYDLLSHFLSPIHTRPLVPKQMFSVATTFYVTLKWHVQLVLSDSFQRTQSYDGKTRWGK